MKTTTKVSRDVAATICARGHAVELIRKTACSLAGLSKLLMATEDVGVAENLDILSDMLFGISEELKYLKDEHDALLTPKAA